MNEEDLKHMLDRAMKNHIDVLFGNFAARKTGPEALKRFQEQLHTAMQSYDVALQAIKNEFADK